MLGLVDGTCSVFSFPDQPASSSSASSMSSSSSSTAASGCPILLRRVAVGYLPSCSNQSTSACSDVSFCCVRLCLMSRVARHTSHHLSPCCLCASQGFTPPLTLHSRSISCPCARILHQSRSLHVFIFCSDYLNKIGCIKCCMQRHAVVIEGSSYRQRRRQSSATNHSLFFIRLAHLSPPDPILAPRRLRHLLLNQLE